MVLTINKKMALFSLILIILAFAIAKTTSPFRYSSHRYIFLYGVFACYLFHFASFIISVVNSIIIIKTLKLDFKNIFWLLLSLVPSLLWGITYCLIVLDFRNH